MLRWSLLLAILGSPQVLKVWYIHPVLDTQRRDRNGSNIYFIERICMYEAFKAASACIANQINLYGELKSPAKACSS